MAHQDFVWQVRGNPNVVQVRLPAILESQVCISAKILGCGDISPGGIPCAAADGKPYLALDKLDRTSAKGFYWHKVAADNPLGTAELLFPNAFQAFNLIGRLQPTTIVIARSPGWSRKASWLSAFSCQPSSNSFADPGRTHLRSLIVPSLCARAARHLSEE